MARKVAKGARAGKKPKPATSQPWNVWVRALTGHLQENVPMSGRVHELAVMVAHAISTPEFSASGSAWEALCVLEAAACDGVGNEYTDGVRLSLSPLVSALRELEGAADACDLAAIAESSAARASGAAMMREASKALRTVIRATAMLCNVTDDTAYSAGSALMSRLATEGRLLHLGAQLAAEDREALVRLNIASDHINTAREQLASEDSESRAKGGELARRVQQAALGMEKVPRDPSDNDRVHFLFMANAIANVGPLELEETIEQHVVVLLPTSYPVWGPRVTRDHLRLLARAWRSESDPNKPQKHEVALAIMREVGLAHASHDTKWLREFARRHQATITKAA